MKKPPSAKLNRSQKADRTTLPDNTPLSPESSQETFTENAGSSSPRTLKGSVKWTFLGLLLASLVSWTVWLPVVVPNLAEKIGIVSIKHIKELYLKTSLLEEEIRLLKALPSSSEELHERAKTISQRAAPLFLSSPPSSLSEASLQKNLTALTGLILLQERLRSAQAYEDVLPLLKDGFHPNAESLTAINILEKYAHQGLPSYEEIKDAYILLKNLLLEKASLPSPEKETGKWLDRIKETLRKWVHLQKKWSFQEKEAADRWGENVGSLIQPKKGQEFLALLEAHKDLSHDQQKAKGYVQAFQEVYKALHALERTLIKKIHNREKIE